MERLILCGGGHVSLQVAWIAQRLDFELFVIDDRADFANRERFPMAREVLCMPTTGTAWSTCCGASTPTQA